jgi:hypothetical protein
MPEVVVPANGSIDLIYLPQTNAKEIVGKIVAMLLGQDYCSGLFVDDALGSYPGTLPLSAINFKGFSVTPVPAIVLKFRSFAAGCADALMCAVNVADTPCNRVKACTAVSAAPIQKTSWQPWARISAQNILIRCQPATPISA